MTKELEKQIKEAAETLKSYGATDVYVFGSAAEGRIGEYSDIDMAVSGLPPGVFFRAMGKAGSILRRELDLINLDHNTPFTRYLREEGELERVG